MRRDPARHHREDDVRSLTGTSIVDFNLTDDQRMLQEGAARYFEKGRDLRQLLELARTGGGFPRAVAYPG